MTRPNETRTGVTWSSGAGEAPRHADREVALAVLNGKLAEEAEARTGVERGARGRKSERVAVGRCRRQDASSLGQELG